MKKYLIVLSAIAFTFSCSDFGDLNVNPKQAELGEAPPETLFAAATKQLSDQMTTTDVNLNIFSCLLNNGLKRPIRTKPITI